MATNKRMNILVNSDCSYCGKIESNDESFKKCGNCELYRYCSKDCQRKDWPQHKKICKLPPGQEVLRDAVSKQGPLRRDKTGACFGSKVIRGQEWKKQNDEQVMKMAKDYQGQGERGAIIYIDGLSTGPEWHPLATYENVLKDTNNPAIETLLKIVEKYDIKEEYVVCYIPNGMPELDFSVCRF